MRSHPDYSILDRACDEGMATGSTKRQNLCPFCKEVVSRKGFVITKVARGFLLWCHRCHGKGFIKSGTPGVRTALSLARTALHPKTQQETLVKTNNITLPNDFVHEIPSTGLLWLRSYGITNEEIRRFGFGYSQRYDRVILPVYKDGTLVYWQGRDISGLPDRPKYHSVAMQHGANVFRVSNPDSKLNVIVEDILSAVIVARAGFNATALLGSYASPTVLRQLASTGQRVVVWLDPDKRKESVNIAKRLHSLGVRSWPVILAGRDPKCYTTEQVRKLVNKGRP